MTSVAADYERSEGAFDAGRIVHPDPPTDHPAVLAWQPLLDLSDQPLACVKARNAAAVATLEGDGAPERLPWTSILPVPGLRAQVVAHAGRADYGVEDPRELPPGLRTARWAGLADALDGWPELGALERARVLATVNNLTLQPVVLRLAGKVAAEDYAGERERELYEIARAAYRTRPGQDPGLSMLDWLAREARDPALRVQCRILLLAGHVRFRGDLDTATRYAGMAEEALRGGAGAPAWLRALLGSRLERARALLVLKVDGPGAPSVGEAMAAARDLATECAERSHDPYLAHLAVENTRLVVESQLKLAGGRRDEALLAATVEEILRLDPFDPELRIYMGDACARVGALDEAIAHYEVAGGLGTFAAALALFKAGGLHEQRGDPDRALVAYGRSAVLDPWALSARERLEELRARLGAGVAAAAAPGWAIAAVDGAAP